ncbi:MAG: AMP-binding protein [Dehalococcoidia bacterium]|nr:AMP-binding protein [Dehalococcoidia bacterium]
MAIKGNQNEFFDELEIMTRETREAYLNQKLREAIEHACHYAPSTREIFDRSKVNPAEIRTTRDLEKLPITRKIDLIELQRERPPYGGLLTIPPEDIDRVFISPGPIYEPLHTGSIKWFAKSFYAAGFRKGDVVINTFTYHMSPAGVLFHEALRDCGATVVVMGTGNTEIQIKTMQDLKVTGFVGTPSFLMNIIKKAEEMGHNFRHDFTLKHAWFTGEMLSPSTREILEKEYQIGTVQAYAVSEPGGAIAYECGYKSGMHLMDEYVVEIVNPETGKQLGPGEIGEIVVTPIHNKAWGLVRFGTGDMSSYTTEPCPCGRTANRLIAIVGRTSDAVKVRGMFIVAKQAEQAILDSKSISKFQIVIRRKGQRDEMILKIELGHEAINKEQLTSDLNERFQNMCRVKIDRIEFVGRGNIPEEHQQIIDERTWK